MIELLQTEVFARWLDGLADERAAARIAQRIVRLQAGLLGDVAPIGEGVSELRVDDGPGYRVYFVRRGKLIVVLLCGGTKRSQAKDIRAAKAMSKEILAKKIKD